MRKEKGHAFEMGASQKIKGRGGCSELKRKKESRRKGKGK